MIFHLDEHLKIREEKCMNNRKIAKIIILVSIMLGIIGMIIGTKIELSGWNGLVLKLSFVLLGVGVAFGVALFKARR